MRAFYLIFAGIRLHHLGIHDPEDFKLVIVEESNS